ncbi:tail fiber assembly protein [Enterobacter quasiroggenkampii]|uniref:tail fiber assembly protein n=1 Tax=Enterobacter quasiroggenkampii TaxID=2497436 RepID=UPI001A1D8EAD|nr:tail fiber assembly protein [Enterobacter quasiroggenkampii]MBJ5867342.1 tail fiber assembly protein [Salmonella enterica subsp. enterica serovar Derby]
MMLTLKNLKQYTPEYYELMIQAVYFQTEDGLDWYYHLRRFQNDTLKICFDEKGIIRSFSYDADRLYPLNMSVTEIDKSEVPEGLNIYGEWMLEKGKIIPVPFDYVSQAEQKRTQLMKVASEKIDALVAASEDGDITEKEESTLARLREYRSALRRLDLSAAPDVQWPEEITDVA